MILQTLCLLLFFSCSRSPSKNDLIGKYSFNMTDYNNLTAVDSIKINSDGTYEYWITDETNVLFSNRSNWSYDSIREFILFENFDYNVGGIPTGNWFSKVVIEENEVRLIYSSEENLYFFKKH